MNVENNFTKGGKKRIGGFYLTFKKNVFIMEYAIQSKPKKKIVPISVQVLTSVYKYLQDDQCTSTYKMIRVYVGCSTDQVYRRVSQCVASVTGMTSSWCRSL